MHPSINELHPYPFQKLEKLLAEKPWAGEGDPIRLTIGEPRHAPPQFVLDVWQQALPQVAKYPTTIGTPELRNAISQWLKQRFNANVSAANQILPVNGTREALFAFAQAHIDTTASIQEPRPSTGSGLAENVRPELVEGQSLDNRPLVASPNPFYQIYEGAALLAGAKPYFVNCDTSGLADFDSVSAEIWQKVQLVYVCSPGNPTGAVVSKEQWQRLIALSDEHDFIIAADECYSEIWFDEPPIGLLQVCAEIGRTDFKNCLVFHSLSKRSNLPGLRSGFVAGDASALASFLKYRTYHGCAMPIPSQLASIEAWGDESHVEENRRLYREKFQRVLEILEPVMEVKKPDASFYLWPTLNDICGGDDEAFAQGLHHQQGVTVLPGSYLSRDTNTGNPGAGHVRISLVASVDECVEAARRIAEFVNANKP
ncbi:MAG: succinyldiaminopimelate transaminase [Gammaproteobacteria bacterium]|nr:succinyldiaminopimelate transaminase [Gammaproteobacteria bacterium]